MKQVILSTRNPSKTLQIKELLKDTVITIHTLDDVGIEGEAIEDGATLEENATKKAVYAFSRAPFSTSAYVVAEDTGLFIPALNNEPGIYAARYAGKHATTEETLRYMLQKLAGITDRRATFTTVVAMITPNGALEFFEGSIEGWMMEEPQAPPQPKMPYSSLFRPCGHDKVWAQMTPQEENAISHRGIAFRKVATFLNNN